MNYLGMSDIEIQLSYQKNQLDKLASQVSRLNYPREIDNNDPHKELKQGIIEGKTLLYMTPTAWCWSEWDFGFMGHPDFNSDIKFKIDNS
jgi:hypothetical protein